MPLGPADRAQRRNRRALGLSQKRRSHLPLSLQTTRSCRPHSTLTVCGSEHDSDSKLTLLPDQLEVIAWLVNGSHRLTPLHFLEVEPDLLVVRDWWSRLQPTLPGGVAGLWFGITDLTLDGQTRRTLYVAGCDRFDSSDPTGDWASAPYAWWPQARYISPPGLAALSGRDYEQALGYAARLVAALRPHEGTNVDGVAVGFDDGDFLVVWSRT
jgi:hypothetical protein